MTPQTLFFVRFISNAPANFPQTQLGLPVFAIDVIDDSCTRFLLADKSNKFHWIDMDQLARVPPQRDQSSNHRMGPKAVLVKH